MATYKPRLKAPTTTDKNYLHYTNGGYNYCIEIVNGSCLPNCVGYAWGRWRELLGEMHNLSRGNAEVWWGNTNDGYKRGQTPKLGAVMCWSKGSTATGSDGCGHVAIVEEIKSNGEVVTSESAYGGTRFYSNTRKPPYYLGSGYTFQGFIYLPITFEGEDEKTTTTSTKEKKATESAKSFNESLVGEYKTTNNLNIRSGAGTSKSVMVVIPKGTIVENYGYYTATKTVKWLYVQFEYKGVKYTGFASANHLTKATSKKYFKRYTGNSGSIVDSLKAIGVDSSFAYREKIAKANGIKSYTSTATQNIKLLNLLKQGKLIVP